MSRPLVRLAAFASGLSSRSPRRPADARFADQSLVEELERLLEGATSKARRTWSTFNLPDEPFCSYLGMICAGGIDELLGSPQLTDLYLVCACLEGIDLARDALQRAHSAGVRAAVRGVYKNDAHVDEIEQSVFIKVLFPSGDQQGLRGYTGRGTLKSWLKVAAVRTALSAVAKKQGEVPLDTGALIAIEAIGDDAEVALARRMNGQAFRAALHMALHGLGTRERDVLRASYGENASVDVIAERFAVHRATAARWLVAAEAEFAARLRGALKERLSVEDRELDSIMRQVDDDVASTLRRHLSELE